MASAVLIPVSEYLHTAYRPDCDYVDGAVQERHLGTEWHGLVQKMIAAIFLQHRKQWKLRSVTEQRIQVSATRYRIPDVCVVPVDRPLQRVMRTPPVLCMEVLSPEDRFAEIQERVREYQRMGVGQVWVIDPESRAIWTAEGMAGLVPLEGGALKVPGADAVITVAEIFEEIDEAPKADASASA